MSSHLSYQYAVGDRVLLSSRISRYLKASPLSVTEQMNLPRGQITDVVATTGGSPHYIVQIRSTAADVVNTFGFGDPSPSNAEKIIEVDESDIISQLGRGQNWPAMDL